MLTDFILAVILAEALTEILKEAVVLEPLRSPLRNWGKKEVEEGEEEEPTYIGMFLDCGYCMSVWVGWGVAFLFRLEVGLAVEWWWLECLIAGLIVHRISNIWHEAIVRWLGKHPFQMVFFNRQVVDAPEDDPKGEGKEPGEPEVEDGQGLQSGS